MTLPQRALGFLLWFSFSSIALAIDLNLSNLNESELPTPPTLAEKTLGTALSLSGPTLAVSARSDSDKSTGSVYIYDALENWRLTAELTTAEGEDNFSRRIILHNNRLIVSAERDDSVGIDSGAVYIFEHDNTAFSGQWQQKAKLIAPDAQAGDHFGEAIFLVDDTLYVGAPLHGRGKVYVFSLDPTNQTWLFQESIEPDDPQAVQFGFAIAKSQNTLIISAPYTDDPVITNQTKQIMPRFITERQDSPDLDGFESGVIFVYQRTGGKWQKAARLSPSNRWSFDHFGEHIAIEDNTIAASINHKFVLDELGAGSVYIFTKNNNEWREKVILTADHPQTSGSFGTDISLLNDHLLVGANKTSENGINSGKLFLFDLGAQTARDSIYQKANATVTAHDHFGFSVALGEESLIASSKDAVYSFQNKPLLQNTAVFYLENNFLQLDKIAIAGVGVYRATLKLSEQSGSFFLTLTNHHFRKGLKNSDVSYSPTDGRLMIPRLALQQSSGETRFYNAVLQKTNNQKELQFKVASLNPIQP